jgi:hypothetical protein
MPEQQLDLSDAISQLLDECRMVLPGIQALFGFQMVAVFSTEFKKLTHEQQELHAGAILLVVLSIILLMTPAALHRQAESRAASDRFLRTASRLLVAAMVPLALAICIDSYLVMRIVWQTAAVATAISVLLLLLFVAFWWLFPRMYRRVS